MTVVFDLGGRPVLAAFSLLGPEKRGHPRRRTPQIDGDKVMMESLIAFTGLGC